ncbi:type II restriction enzyme [Campylobacter helveticus]|uniref:type II restriction enzyme n=1 Tax=Campylobacter helveticus TaxID=28898 RepID=UPI0011126076|nr:hypothetical protein [Campylobacter helveticus]TNB54961.1 hypothetical protein FDW47_05725 [Campylobacter helveticus]TNB62238.1 hypothetical protein FDW43_07045 [Campylobacter helveticus]
MRKVNKKHLVLESLLAQCKEQNDFIFHNDLVKEICKQCGFGNPFDATKLDSSEKLPQIFIKENICILHLGGGYHQFIKGIDKLYHPFEALQESLRWEYRKSLLNEYNDSESNILSVANNQRILHHFLFGEDLEFENLSIEKRPKTYFPHRTKTSLSYFFDTQKIEAKNQQIEIDLTLEFDGIIGIFEAKNGEPKDFNIYQIYHPFLYYYNSKLTFKKIICVYLVRKDSSLKLWAYTFNEPLCLDSITFLKSREYILVRQ